jgi:hypothetical protein
MTAVRGFKAGAPRPFRENDANIDRYTAHSLKLASRHDMTAPTSTACMSLREVVGSGTMCGPSRVHYRSIDIAAGNIDSAADRTYTSDLKVDHVVKCKRNNANSIFVSCAAPLRFKEPLGALQLASGPRLSVEVRTVVGFRGRTPGHYWG